MLSSIPCSLFLCVQCWGCLVWVPTFYTSHTLYLADNPTHLGPVLALVVFLVGTAGVFINYAADHQKEVVRNTGGDCQIWGRKAEAIKATYFTSKGEEKTSLLLVCGWWGVSRHFHYIPELLAAFCWSVPALFHSFIPYFYFIFLSVLLTHRAYRDDQRCHKKYGKFWDEYCKAVPYKIVPFLL